MIFKYCLPALLGYTLFIGISGQFWPFKRPAAMLNRPAWFLGLWIGAAVALLLGAGLHYAFQLELASIGTLLKPAAIVTTAALLPGIVGYFAYKKAIQPHLDTTHQYGTPINQADVEDAQTRIVWDTHNSIEPGLMDIDITDPVEPILVMDDEQLASAKPDTHNPDTGTVNAKAPADEASMDDALNEDLLPANLNASLTGNGELEPVTEFSPADSAADEYGNHSEMAMGMSTNNNTIVDGQRIAGMVQPVALSAAMVQWNDTINTARDVVPAATAAELEELRETLQHEQALRQEVENHLRITRKGLAAIESETRTLAVQKTNDMIMLEENLEKSIKAASLADARAERELSNRTSIEANIIGMKEDLLKAKQSARKSTDARARAISTANKATTFARQTMVARTRLETKLRETQTALINRKTTVSSLVKALEKEKRRTKTQIADMARQMVIQEKQKNARRSLEEASQRQQTNGRATRLIKKVAKARPAANERQVEPKSA